jgi:hypothetical protein
MASTVRLRLLGERKEERLGNCALDILAEQARNIFPAY